MGVRRAFVWASAGRYLVMVINLGAMLALARLLTPGDFGITVLGSSVMLVAEALRALGGGMYLVQKPDLQLEDIRACFSVSLLATLFVAGMVLLMAPTLSHLFGVAELIPYLRVSAIGYLAGPFSYPIGALLGRNLRFSALATITVIQALIGAVVSVTLAFAGFRYMSFAWGLSASTVVAMLLYLAYWRQPGMFRPRIRGWRSVLSFGLYDSASALIGQMVDAAPYLIFGRFFDTATVGLGQRAINLCSVTDRVILSGVGAVALPAFAQQVRDGQPLRASYLRALALLTAAQWPCLTLLAVLAEPIVRVLLGPQWLAAIPLMRILSGALLFSFPMTLNYALMVAIGAIRFLPPMFALMGVVSVGVVYWTAHYDLTAAAWGAWIIMPFNCLVVLLVGRQLAGFRLRELATTLAPSGLVTLLAVAGPLAIALVYRSSSIGPAGCLLALLSAALGWLLGLRWTRHPLRDELLRAVSALGDRRANRLLRPATWLLGA